MLIRASIKVATLKQLFMRFHLSWAPTLADLQKLVGQRRTYPRVLKVPVAVQVEPDASAAISRYTYIC